MGSERTKQNAGAVPQGTNNEKTIKKEVTGRSFQPSSKRFQLFEENDKDGVQPKTEKSGRKGQIAEESANRGNLEMENQLGAFRLVAPKGRNYKKKGNDHPLSKLTQHEL